MKSSAANGAASPCAIASSGLNDARRDNPPTNASAITVTKAWRRARKPERAGKEHERHAKPHAAEKAHVAVAGEEGGIVGHREEISRPLQAQCGDAAECIVDAGVGRQDRRDR